MEKNMLKEENRIFKNLYNEHGWKINDALKRDDLPTFGNPTIPHCKAIINLSRKPN